MSYNAGSIEIVASEDFRISADALTELAETLAKMGVHPPDSSILDPDWRASAPFGQKQNCHERDGIVFPRRFSWRGEGSGYSWDALVEVVLPAFDGSVDLAVTWENGDSFSGLRLRDHKVTKHKIVMTLGDELAD